MGKFYRGKAWEQRWIVVAGTQLLYYQLGEEDGEPRGCIDLIQTAKVSIQVATKTSADAPSPHRVDVSIEPPEQKPAAASGEAKVAPVRWTFCFDSQQHLMQFLEVVHNVLEKGGQLKEKDSNRFEHDFMTGDHIFRWEMIVCPPVIYPIQIHGIVLEAGRNALLVADFGLTGYGRKKGEDFNHADDRHANMVLEQWRKLRPKDVNQRLNIVTLTDPLEIRKWFKANYEESRHGSTGKKLKKITNFMSKLRMRTQSSDGSPKSTHSGSTVLDESDHRPTTEASPKKENKEPLPKSDPREIVLARAHFLLEHEHVLPPYHIFFSNSECIAVWCKTGRWSTLQTAVFLATNSVGGAKSATIATIGVAAAHALLAPVVVVGGLLWVSAPMIILRKSRAKWEEATMSLTQLFWEWAPPDIYVAAIENWSGLSKSTK